MKINKLQAKEFVLAFFSMALFSISNVYYLNIVFFVFWMMSALSSKGKMAIIDKRLLKYLLLYLIWVFLDALCVSVNRGYPFQIRNFIQIVFEVQYLIWVMDINIDINKYIDYLISISICYSILLIVTFFVTGTYLHLNQIYGIYREWGAGIFPGNTTSAPVPFIFALFWCLYYNKGYGKAALITIGAILFPSRVSLLAAMIVWLFFVYQKMSRKMKNMTWVVGGLFAICIPELLTLMKNYLPDLAYRLTLTWDRVDILKTVFYYLSKHMVTGYGGRTLNQLYDLIPYITNTGIRWPHAHNFVFEELLRYGAIGAVLFTLILIRIYRLISNKKIKFIYILFLVIALFQTYMREFNYIFYIYIIICGIYKGDRDDNL